MLRSWSCLALLIALGTTGSRADDKPSFHDDPIEKYQRISMHGWNILLSPRLGEHGDDAQASIRELDAQLGRIERVVPPRPLAELRKIPIWFEWAENDGLAEFHWDPDTLRQQHRNVAKSGAVEVTNASHLVEWSFAQPYVLLHELSHGYQRNVVGKDDPRLTRAYERAMKSGKYDNVEYVTYPSHRPAYAKANKLEYFAEATESYFGENDFQPWDNADLKRIDPTGYQLMVAVWGKPAAPADRPPGPPYIGHRVEGGGKRPPDGKQSARTR